MRKHSAGCVGIADGSALPSLVRKHSMGCAGLYVSRGKRRTGLKARAVVRNWGLTIRVWYLILTEIGN